ncbi:hypothetical protein GAB14E_3870 [Colwellia psychrerythraea]|uniref:Uncharacterized protein n=1 Tax=Colwellia psychrerythraea TaxID=28229 RepID=A0A099KG21_COLPS|nr:hypothetical protein GAB14E_3870 [Colwellia psychrerythraea]
MRFAFADIIVDCDQVKLTKHAKHMECEPRIFELLVYFFKHRKKLFRERNLGRRPNTCNISYQHDFFACEKVESNTSNIWQFQLPL